MSEPEVNESGEVNGENRGYSPDEAADPYSPWKRFIFLTSYATTVICAACTVYTTYQLSVSMEESRKSREEDRRLRQNDATGEALDAYGALITKHRKLLLKCFPGMIGKGGKPLDKEQAAALYADREDKDGCRATAMDWLNATATISTKCQNKTVNPATIKESEGSTLRRTFFIFQELIYEVQAASEGGDAYTSIIQTHKSFYPAAHQQLMDARRKREKQANRTQALSECGPLALLLPAVPQPCI